MQEYFRAIPSVDICLNTLRDRDTEIASAPHAMLCELVTSFWDARRNEIRNGRFSDPSQISLASQIQELCAFVRQGIRPNLRRVLNATGVIIHTNLGRSVLSEEASLAAYRAARGYSNLEMDLKTGERGSRHDITEKLICDLTGAEAALIVNNNAAAVLLILDTLCSEGETIVSRGELIEIGGSFRIPDIMAKSGSYLREVGTTNRTHLKDYRGAINENTKAILSVHTSNFRVIGFHKAVELKELAELAKEHDLPLIFDLGSGNLLDFSATGLPYEPTVSDVLSAGADCVSFSGDKALGGPQAGIIAGKKIYIDQFKKNPLTRALRCDKLCLAALEATLRAYLDPDLARGSIPTPSMISMGQAELKKRAHMLGNKLKKSLDTAGIDAQVSYASNSSRVGGGAFPECDLPTTLVGITSHRFTPQQLRDQLLKTEPPLIGRLEDNAFYLDPRTLDKAQYAEVIRVLTEAMASVSDSHKRDLS